MKNLLLLAILAVTFCMNSFAQTDKDAAKSQKSSKMTAEEVVSKHLASIGSAADLAAVKSRIMVGVGQLGSSLGYSGQIGGPAQFASEGDKVLFAMIFSANDYPYEKAGFDGERLTVGKQEIGVRSSLGDFLKSEDIIFKQGLFGGTLSSDWALLDLNARKAKVQYAGIEKFNNRQAYKLKYISSRGGNLKISLYFDTETFQHLGSEYEYVIPPKIGVSDLDTANQRESRFILTETFADFKIEGRLTLPHTYVLNLTTQTDSTKSLQWIMKFSQFIFNQPLDAQSFRLS